MGPETSAQRKRRYAKVGLLVALLIPIWGLLGATVYFNFFHHPDLLTYDEIGQCLDSKPQTVAQLTDCLAHHCSTHAQAQLAESSIRQRDGKDGVLRLLGILKLAETRVGKQYDVHHGEMLVNIADSDVVDIQVIKPEESTGTTAWGAGGTYRAWYIIVGKNDRILTWIPSAAN